jgi:uncharacterized protein (DUF2336 family)
MLNMEQLEETVVDYDEGIRIGIAEAIGDDLTAGSLNRAQRENAFLVLRALARDVETAVRAAVAQHIKECPFLPRGLARELAMDVVSVAIPIISFSTALTDEDLVEIVRLGHTAKNIAIATRKSVPQVVSGALAEDGDRQVVSALLDNIGARVSQNAYGRIIDRFSDDERILLLVNERPSLPVNIVDRLASVASEALRERIVTRHGMPQELTDDIVTLGREGFVAGQVRSHPGGSDFGPLVTRLGREDRLTATLLLRALFDGEVAFFDTAMAKLAGLPKGETRTWIHDRGPGGFKSIFRRTSLPPITFPAIRTAVRTFDECEPDGAPESLDAYRDKLVIRLLREYNGLAPAPLEGILSQLGHLFQKGEDPLGKHQSFNQ